MPKTKKLLIDEIKLLLKGTERVFFTPSLSRLRKADLSKKLDILRLLLIAQKKYGDMVNAMALSVDDLLIIALNGPQDKLERELTMWRRLADEYAEEFDMGGA